MRSLLDMLAPPLCAGCGASAGSVEPLCAGCRAELCWLPPHPVETVDGLRAWAPLAYEGPARGVVRALKFKGATRAASDMAAQIAANAPAGWLAPPAQLVPVPLHPARQRKRGYNQAKLLARAVASRTGIETCDCLTRTGPRGTQVGRDRHQRLAGIAGSVDVSAPAPAFAVLVDDVITTGATLAACAAVLRQNGAAHVVAVAYARTPGR